MMNTEIQIRRDNLLNISRDIIPGIFISHCSELRSHMHDRKGQWNGLSAKENHRTLLFFCQKVFSGINVLLSMIYNEKERVCECVCVCAGRLGLLSLHYTRAGSTSVLCPRSLPLPTPTWNNELQRMPWGGGGGWVGSAQEWTPFQLKIRLTSHSNGRFSASFLPVMSSFLKWIQSHSFSVVTSTSA